MTLQSDGRPEKNLSGVLEDLGAMLLERVAGGDLSSPIGGIVIYDRLDDGQWPDSCLVLGVGIEGNDQIAGVLEELVEKSAIGIVVRAPVTLDDSLRLAFEQAGIALLALNRGAAWVQVASLLRTSLSEGGAREVQETTNPAAPVGDLFAIANAVEALVGAPVTIEDRNSRLLAFSSNQDGADRSRTETILGREVPERVLRSQMDLGIFTSMYRSDAPVWVPPDSIPGEAVLPRWAIAVRAGGEVLGSIFALEIKPFTSIQKQAMVDAARLVALHLLHHRAVADVDRRLRAELLATALNGGRGTHEALTRLGLSDDSFVVLGMSARASTDSNALSVVSVAHARAAREKLNDAFGIHLQAVHTRSVAALIGDVTYGLMPVDSSGDPAALAMTVGEDFLRRVGSKTAVIAVGPVARTPPEIARAHLSVDRILRVLLSACVGTRRVAQLPDVHVDILMRDVHDILEARGEPVLGPLSDLIEYDRERGSDLMNTLCAYLDAFGDVTRAAKSTFIHPNTFRYRLRRLEEVSHLDLMDPHQRFDVMLRLRLLDVRTDQRWDVSR